MDGKGSIFSQSSPRREGGGEREREQNRQKDRQAQRKSKIEEGKKKRAWLSVSLNDGSDKAHHGLVMRSAGK